MQLQGERSGGRTGSGSGSRIEWMDSLKGFSIVLVVFCHLVLLPGESVAGNYLMTLAWGAVPCFMMVSGALAHQKKNFSLKSHLRKTGKTYLVLSAWKLIFLLVQLKTDAFAMGKAELLGYLFLFRPLDGVTTGPLWYMEAYLLVLLFFPVSWNLWRLGKEEGTKAIVYLIAITGITGILLPSMAWGQKQLSGWLNISGVEWAGAAKVFPLSNYSNMLFYYFTGSLLQKQEEVLREKAKGRKWWFAAGILVFAFLLMTVKRIDTGTYVWNNTFLSSGYNRIMTAAMSLCMYLTFLLFAEKWKGFNRILGQRVGQYTMGIYYMHYPILLLCREYLYPSLTAYYSVGLNLVKTVAVTALCIVLVRLMRKVKMLRDLVR